MESNSTWKDVVVAFADPGIILAVIGGLAGLLLVLGFTYVLFRWGATFACVG